MRNWWTVLGVLGVGAAMGICVGSAVAQYPPGGGMMGPPPGGGMMPPGMMGPPPGGMPGAGMPGAGMAGPPPGAFGGMPGAFGGGPSPVGAPADFPNPAQPSQEPASPFSIKEEGNPNAFTDLLSPPNKTQPYALTFRGEYVGWTFNNGPINVPLVTTTSSPGAGSMGQLGNGGTSILVGSGNNVDYGWSSGFRVTAGLAIGYLPPIEISGFYVNQTATIFSGGGNGQYLAMPFQNTAPTAGLGAENAFPINVPAGSALAAQSGTINITSELTFWNIEANVLIPLTDPTATCQVSFIAGYRHLQLDETLNIGTQVSGAAGGTSFLGATLPSSTFSTSTMDTFATTNAFDGGQFGFRGVLNMGQWSLFTDLKLGLGENTETLYVNGSSTVSQAVAGRSSQTAPGGIYAVSSNATSLSSHQFAFVPEANIALSFQFCPAIRAFVGYDILYWSRVTRPGDAISGTIDARQIPTSPGYTAGVNYNGPAPSQINQRYFLAQGLFAGIEIGF